MRNLRFEGADRFRNVAEKRRIPVNLLTTHNSFKHKDEMEYSCDICIEKGGNKGVTSFYAFLVFDGAIFMFVIGDTA